MARTIKPDGQRVSDFMENPYSPPQTPSEPIPEVPRFRPLAVVVGWLTDISFSCVTGLVVGIVAAVPLIMQGTPPERLQAELNNMTWVHGVGVLLGCCGTVLGGFVAAWIGKDFPLRHAFAVAMVSLLTALALIVPFPHMQPLWVSVTGLALVVPAGLLGGYLRSALGSHSSA